ncbi:serine/threonine protein kinase [Paraliomyxa miuraensis]|uniref:serine/threonine protein kinase n=1 Tax=Paraliomyxa miuraensis TaxID=376150 RepID=UPI002255023C|nr:serine/threonine-protein kinase [Paraliomyxa miuraensis]
MTQAVGQYELIRRIGSGGMAEVWMGRRASVGGATKSVAIKLMAPRVAQDERHRRMFLAEARLSMLMTHSNVVQVFDAGEDDGRLYLVMEWIDGLNLAQLCELRRREGQPWPPAQVGYVIGEVLRGLAYAHHLTHEGRTECVVHRDVSPHNVLVSTSGEVKIADFGVARLSSEETSGLHIKGKLRYMAPEQLAGRSKEPSVDLYGVGAMLHELLTGARFRDQADEVELYGQILGGHIPPLQVPDVPPELVSLREGLLQAEVRQRIPSATRALEYLAAWAGYRNMAVELGSLCRTAMGVVAPRSGIEPTDRSLGPLGQAGGRSVGSSGPVIAGTETEAATGAARTSGAAPAAMPTRTSGAMPQAATPTRTSGAVQAAAPTRTSGAVHAAMPIPASEAMAVAATRTSVVTHRPGPRPQGRRGLLAASAILGLGFLAGGIGVAVMVRGREGDEREPSEGGGAIEPPPTEDPSVVAQADAKADERMHDPIADDSSAGQGTTAITTGVATDESTALGTTGTSPSLEDDGSSGEAAAPASATRRAPKSAKVKFGLRSPVRFAYVRIGRKEFSVDPVAERTLPAGRTSIWWRSSADGPWVDGGTFTFEAGRRYQVRLTKSGPVVE